MKQLVIGLGESGLAMVRHAVRVGASVAVYDSRTAPALLATAQETYPNVAVHLGQFDARYLDGIDQIAISPGLSPHQSPLKEIIAAAQARAIAVVGELDLFGAAIDALNAAQNYQPKIVAITGTNGKTTVTALTKHLCQAAGVHAIAAGNISPSMLDALCDALDADALPSVWVLELSSFQLQFARSFAADAATVLNLSQDHLDWHLDGAEYQGAKAKIFGAKTIQILNRDDANVMAMAQADHAQHSFGLNKPAQAHAYGLWQDGSVEWLCVANVLANEQPQTKANKANPPEVVLDVVRVMPVNALRIRGRHNALNALAALALCRAIELPLSKLLHGLRTYAGEPHRVQLIHTIGGVDFYDDSKGTNVGATVAAISGLDQPIILIAGGDGKGQDFAPLAACVQGRVKQIELIGKDAQRLQAALSESGAQITLHDSLELATQAAAHAALTGDVVLLSPACASLDMFKNYAHRAQVFADAVAEFAHQRGQL